MHVCEWLWLQTGVMCFLVCFFFFHAKNWLQCILTCVMWHFCLFFLSTRKNDFVLFLSVWCDIYSGVIYRWTSVFCLHMHSIIMRRKNLRFRWLTFHFATKGHVHISVGLHILMHIGWTRIWFSAMSVVGLVLLIHHNSDKMVQKCKLFYAGLVVV